MPPSLLPDVEGWDVVSADAVRVGQVRESREGFLIVELVPTLRGAAEHQEVADLPAVDLS